MVNKEPKVALEDEVYLKLITTIMNVQIDETPTKIKV